MTDYYELFKGEVEKTCGEYGRAVAALKKELAGIEKRLEDEKDNARRLQERGAKLETQTATQKCLTGTKNQYEGFRASLLKLNRQAEASETLVTALQGLLDKKTKELAHAEDNLVIVLRNCLVSHRPVADGQIEDLLLAAFGEYDAFLAAWRRIFDEYGKSFVCNNETYSPGPWPAREVEELRSRLDVSARRRASRKAVEVPKVSEPVQAPAEATGTPQAVQTE